MENRVSRYLKCDTSKRVVALVVVLGWTLAMAIWPVTLSASNRALSVQQASGLVRGFLGAPGLFGENVLANGTSPGTNNSTGTSTPCSPPPGYTCVDVVPPQLGGTYLGSINFGSIVVSSDSIVFIQPNTKVSISPHSLASGYEFSFWGASTSGITIAQFEQSSTSATITGYSSLYLNVCKTSSCVLMDFDVAYQNVSTGSSAGAIEVENHDFSKGQGAYLTSGQPYAIGLQDVASSYAFGEWVSKVGSFGNLTQEFTTFTPSSGGTVYLILSQLSGKWGGYVYTGSSLNSA